MDEPDDDLLPLCKICGAVLEWVDCWNGCDDGCFDGYEEDPLWYDEGDTYPCDVCGGQGGWLQCPNAEHHAAILAEQGGAQ